MTITAERIFKVVAEHFEIPAGLVDRDTKFEDLAGDPLDGVELLMDIEEELDADLSSLDFPATVGELVDLVELVLQSERA